MPPLHAGLEGETVGSGMNAVVPGLLSEYPDATCIQLGKEVRVHNLHFPSECLHTIEEVQGEAQNKQDLCPIGRECQV